MDLGEGTYFTISYVISLRGPEVLLLDLEGVRRHFNSQFGDDGSPERHVVALLGQVKGQHNERQHLLVPSVNKTKSGIQVYRWLRRALAANFSEGRATDPTLCDEKGIVLTTRVMNGMLYEMLEEMDSGRNRPWRTQKSKKVVSANATILFSVRTYYINLPFRNHFKTVIHVYGKGG